MHIFSWNIQSGKGCDGIVDLDRIINLVYSSGEFDLICLQEVARNLNEYCSPEQMDQLEILNRAFDTYRSIWGTGFSWPFANTDQNESQEFGNLTLIKQQLLDHKIHHLPIPATPGKKQMPRVAVESVVDSTIGPVSIINTHLAYHDEIERQQQLDRLSLLEQERKDHLSYPKQQDVGAYKTGPTPQARILCGDFNFGTEYPEYEFQIKNNWIDAWTASNNSQTHSPTCGIYDHTQWPQGPHCRDYFWLSSELQPVAINMKVNTETPFSDHQPIMLEIKI